MDLTWTAAPLDPNELAIAVLVHDADPGAYSGPSGWTNLLVGSQAGIPPCWSSLWYNEGGVNGAQTWSWANTVTTAGCGATWDGIDDNSPAAQDGKGQGTDDSLETSSETTTQADELLVYGAGQAVTSLSALTFSGPTNSFSIIVQKEEATGTRVTAALVARIVAATGTYDSVLTSTQAASWNTLFGTFFGGAASYSEVMFPHTTMQLPSRVALPRAEVIGY